MLTKKKTPRKGLLERRDRILEAAIEVFAEKGYDRATVDDIAERADVGKGTIYNRVGRKEDFFGLLIQRTAKIAFDNLKSAVSKKSDPILQFKEMINTTCDVFESNLNHLMFLWTHIMTRANRESLDIKETLVAHKDIARLFHLSEDIFNRAIKQKQLRPVDVPVMVRALFQFLEPSYYQYLRSKCNYTKGEIAQLTIDLFLKGLQPRK